MDRNLKIGLYTIGGLILATGIYFGVRALVRGSKRNKLSDAERLELDELRQKLADGTLTDEERIEYDRLRGMEGDTNVIDDKIRSWKFISKFYFCLC